MHPTPAPDPRHRPTSQAALALGVFTLALIGVTASEAWPGLGLASPDVSMETCLSEQPDPAARPDAAEAPPPTRRDDVVDIIHGRRVEDPYRWLEDPAVPEAAAWMEAQDAFARARLDALPGRDTLRTRLEQLSYVDSVSAPVVRGPYEFYWRRHADREKSILYVRRDGDPERVLIDPNPPEGEGEGPSIRGVYPTHDGARLAYAVSENNADASVLRVLDTATGEDLPGERLVGMKYASPRWLPDGSAFYYTGLPDDPTIPPADLPGHASVRLHRLGEPQADDVEVWPASGNPRQFVGVDLSRDGRYLLVYVQRGWVANDVYLRDTQADRDGPLRPLVEGRQALYDVTVHDGRFFIHTNEGAPRYRVLEADPAAPARDRWIERVPEGSSALQSARVLGGALVLHYLERARSRVAVHELDGAHRYTLDLPMGSVSGLTGRVDRDTAYVSFSGFTQPHTVYRTSIATGALEPWAETTVPVDPDRFAVSQVHYPSRDGTEISMFVVAPRGYDPKTDGPRPTLLTGYGGFGVSMTPYFSTRAVLWVEQGGVYAVPNLRGGGEYGEDWHKDGMRERKQNVFDDFEHAARYLQREGYTTPAQLSIAGGSNGGLLVGAAMTQHPELYGAVICSVPLLDMIRYHRFGSGQTWIPEYGDPDDPGDFEVLFAYSPYHHVDPNTRYPALLMHSADSDDRVDPMHARKFTAQIQATRGDRPAWLRIEKNAGHGGADLVRAGIEREVDTQAFLREQLGLIALPDIGE